MIHLSDEAIMWLATHQLEADAKPSFWESGWVSHLQDCVECQAKLVSALEVEKGKVTTRFWLQTLIPAIFLMGVPTYWWFFTKSPCPECRGNKHCYRCSGHGSGVLWGKCGLCSGTGICFLCHGTGYKKID